jgi:hypothetical protein
MDVIEHGCIALRTLLYPNWIDHKTGKPLAKAFLRRKPKADGSQRDPKGLSVEHGIQPAECGSKLGEKAGIADLRVDFVRSLAGMDGPLDVVPDGPNHANITGLPKPHENDEALARANYLAKTLADSSDVVHKF